MHRMRSTAVCIRSAAVCIVLTLAGCAIGKPIPQATTYAVDPPTPQLVPAAARQPEALRIGNVRVAAAYASNALVYRMDDVRYVADPYHAFIAEPAALLGNQMALWLDRAGAFSSVSARRSAGSAPYVLEATVTELYGDFRPGQRPAAVVAIQFALIDQRAGVRPQSVQARTIASRVDLPQASPDVLVRGYGAALAEILMQFVGDLDFGSTDSRTACTAASGGTSSGVVAPSH
jgi:cholesterol transport system auxiliary component